MQRREEVRCRANYPREREQVRCKVRSHRRTSRRIWAGTLFLQRRRQQRRPQAIFRGAEVFFGGLRLSLQRTRCREAPQTFARSWISSAVAGRKKRRVRGCARYAVFPCPNTRPPAVLSRGRPPSILSTMTKRQPTRPTQLSEYAAVTLRALEDAAKVRHWFTEELLHALMD